MARDKFYISGSLVKAKIDNTSPLAYGMPSTANMFFENSPVFRVGGDGTTAVVEAKSGEGKVFVMGTGGDFPWRTGWHLQAAFQRSLLWSGQTSYTAINREGRA